MSILGIIVEYNPLHNGHIYHIEESAKLTNSNSIVAVISGNFVQRGEPSIIDKWSRTKMALLSGVDLVIELPTVYAVSTAETFAYGACKLLDSLRIIDFLSFGSEAGTITWLNKIASLLVEEPKIYKDYLKKSLSTGITYAAAREFAITSILGENYSKFLKNSNNILAIEYLKALLKLNSKIKPLTIKRIGPDYNSLNVLKYFASATSIRHNILKGDKSFLDKCLPPVSKEILINCFAKGLGPVSLEQFSSIILYLLRSGYDLKNVFDVGEGLENRIYKAAKMTNNIYDLINMVKTKRYTESRLKRILIHALLGINSELYKSFAGPNYIRVLGFNSKGLNLLKLIHTKSNLPIITRVGSYKKSIKDCRLFEKDLFATDIYTLALKGKPSSGMDLTQPIIIN
ncbi:MAG: nucleotidyltransferase [Thermoanaerobacteraceae bacterium]|nr:nucleotidyltransferase [Thermoanaerobacteraceae bacterium]